MKRALFFLLFSMTLIISAFSQNSLDKPIVIIQFYTTEAITLTQFQQVLEYQKQVNKVGSFSPEDKRLILDEMVNEKLVLQAAKNEGITISSRDAEQYLLQSISMQVKLNIDTMDKYMLLLKEQGIKESDAKSYMNEQLEMVKKQLLVDTFIKQTKRERFENVPQPTEKEISLFFQDNETQFINPQLIRANQIFFDTTKADVEQLKGIKSQAEAAYQKIKDGASFDSVMSSLPVNPASPMQNGDMGYIPRGTKELINVLGNEFNDTLFRMRKGDVGLLRSKLGYHIMQVTEFHQKKFLSLDDPLNPSESTTVREYIKTNLYQNKLQLEYQKVYEEIKDELRELAELKYFDENL